MLIAYIIGLGYGVHMAGLLVAPAVGLAILIRRPQDDPPLEAAARVHRRRDPRRLDVRHAADPRGALPGASTKASRPRAAPSCTSAAPFSKGTYDAFMYNFNRGQYGKPELTERQAPLSAQIGMWWLYFKWQWVRDAHGRMPGLQGMLASVFLVLGLIGGWVHWRRDPRSFAFFGPLMLTLTLVLIYYLNFKYGASQDPDLADSVQREVRDRDYFFLWSFSAWSVWAALGLTYLWESLGAVLGHETQKIGGEMVELPTKRSWLLTSPILLLAIVPLFANWQAASRAGQTDTARLRDRHAQLRRAVRRARDRRRQRHLPALVRAGSARRPQGRDRREHVADEHRLVHAADDPPRRLRLRRGQGSRRVSRKEVGEAGGPADQDDVRSGGLGPDRQGAHAAAAVREGPHPRGRPSALPRARRLVRPQDDPGRRAPDLPEPHLRQLRQRARPRRLHAHAGARTEADA